MRSLEEINEELSHAFSVALQMCEAEGTEFALHTLRAAQCNMGSGAALDCLKLATAASNYKLSLRLAALRETLIAFHAAQNRLKREQREREQQKCEKPTPPPGRVTVSSIEELMKSGDNIHGGKFYCV